MPALIAVLICETGAIDPVTGKKTLIGIFDRLVAPRFPTMRPVFVYWKITDAVGFYTVTMKVVRTQGNVLIAQAGNMAVNLENRLLSYDFLMPAPPPGTKGIFFPEPGRYEFQIFMNDTYLGGSFIDASNERVQEEGP